MSGGTRDERFFGTMFLRKNRRVKNGKPHFYWSLVETIRTPKGPRQRVVGYLGDLDEEREESYRGLVRRLEGKSAEQYSLFKPRRAGAPVTIFPEKIRVERVRDFGDASQPLILMYGYECDSFNVVSEPFYAWYFQRDRNYKIIYKGDPEEMQNYLLLLTMEFPEILEEFA